MDGKNSLVHTFVSNIIAVLCLLLSIYVRVGGLLNGEYA